MEQKQSTKLGLSAEDVRQDNSAAEKLAGLFRAMGDAECDALALARSEDGRLIGQWMNLMQWKEDSPECLAYWADCGLKKQLHGDPADVHSRWASYLPLAVEREPDRRFPLIFCLHGAHNPIQMTECYGVIQLAAREECIVIAPENENLDHILALLDYAKSHYPVDPSRVYSIGYSFGGFMSSRNVLAKPELFAGVGMGGMLFAGEAPAHELDGQPYPPYRLTEEMARRAAALEMPALLFMGENEMLHLEPLWREPEGEVKTGMIPLSSRDKQSAFNRWRQAGGCAPYEFREAAFYQASDDPVVKSIGAEFERTQVREYHGRRYYLGDSLNQSGECLFRTVSCQGMAHWPTALFAQLVWEHIGKYARDPKTGKLIRL